MNKIKLPKIERFTKLCNNFLYKKNIIIFVGNNGTLLSAFIHGNIIESIFIPLDTKFNLTPYKEFLNKFKNFYIFFLIDNSLCEVHHVSLPILQSLIRVNPVEKFIAEYFSKDDIVAYNVYDITKNTSEMWHVIISSIQYEKPLSSIIEYIFGHSLKFGGIYCLALEFQIIIDKTLKNTTQGVNCSNYLQIFVTILNSCGIKLVVKHKSDIMDIKTLEYLKDKPDQYIYGLIEQAVNDNLIFYKNYVDNLGLKVCIIFLAEKNLNSLLKESHFNGHKLIFVSSEELYTQEGKNITNFSDLTILKSFSHQKSFLASNNDIKAISKLNLLNFIIFKPFILTITILLLVLFSVKFETLKNYSKLSSLDSKYYQILQEYRKIKNKYPYIEVDSLQNSSLSSKVGLADLYSMETLLSTPIKTPFDLLEQFLIKPNSDIKIKRIEWELQSFDNILTLSKHGIKIEILLEFGAAGGSLEKTMMKLNKYINNLKLDLSPLEVEAIIKSDEIINLPYKIGIPVYISIVNQYE